MQRDLEVAAESVKGISNGDVIMQVEPIIAVVDKSMIKQYCSWCFKNANPKGKPGSKEAQAQDDPANPESYIEIVNLRSCSKCKFVHYCCQDCQRAHWPEHKPECDKDNLPLMPSPLRLLLGVMRLKTNSDNKDHLANLHKFRTKVLTMVSMASQ